MPTQVSSGSGTLGGLIQSIRAQIPDPVADGEALDTDGQDFSFSILLQWINDGLRILCTNAPVINDWYAIASEEAMDLYVLPSEIQAVEQLWYDNWPCWRSPELDTLFVTKITSRSYFFGPHSIHAVPRLQVWPACDRTATVTTLTSDISAEATTIPLANVSTFRPYGFVKIEDELILYRTNNTGVGNAGTLTQILRGQGGTEAAIHINGTTAYECNIMFRCSKLATPLQGLDDLIEIPVGLTPLLELYVLSKVRQSEQEFQMASQMLSEFDKATQQLANRAQLKGLKQSIQVRDVAPGPFLYNGRVFVPAIIGMLVGLLHAFV